MTDERLIKVLECCANEDCDNCPSLVKECQRHAMLNALNLIERYEEIIERLNVELDAMRGAANSYKMHYNEAIKEFAERLKDMAFVFRSNYEDGSITRFVCVGDIDNLVKEMTEGNSNESISKM